MEQQKSIECIVYVKVMQKIILVVVVVVTVVGGATMYTLKSFRFMHVN